MCKSELTKRPLDAAQSFRLSLAGHSVLNLLRKGCAYQVRGAWRFQGLRRAIMEPTLFSLLEKGLAERVEADRCVELRITLAGRAVHGVSKRPREASKRTGMVRYSSMLLRGRSPVIGVQDRQDRRRDDAGQLLRRRHPIAGVKGFIVNGSHSRTARSRARPRYPRL